MKAYYQLGDPLELLGMSKMIQGGKLSVLLPQSSIPLVAVRTRIFLQSLWKLRQGWDEQIHGVYKNGLIGRSNWESSQNSLYYGLILFLVYVFGDASERAFGPVACFRFEWASGQRHCAFVTAKTRVAPVKPLIIRWQKLQAAVLNVRLVNMILEEHGYKIYVIYFWTDIRTAIEQIRGPSKRHPSFTANRLSEI